MRLQKHWLNILFYWLSRGTTHLHNVCNSNTSVVLILELSIYTKTTERWSSGFNSTHWNKEDIHCYCWWMCEYPQEVAQCLNGVDVYHWRPTCPPGAALTVAAGWIVLLHQMLSLLRGIPGVDTLEALSLSLCYMTLILGFFTYSNSKFSRAICWWYCAWRVSTVHHNDAQSAKVIFRKCIHFIIMWS